jgi:hypothetical protein
MRNQRENDTNFSKIVGMGPLDCTFSVKLTNEEVIHSKINLDNFKTLQDVSSLLENNDIRNKFLLESNPLVTMLTFVNKTSNNKVLAEFLSINSLNTSEKNSEFLEKIRNDFDDNYLFLIERNILPNYNLTLKLDIQGKKYILADPHEKKESTHKENNKGCKEADPKDLKPKGINDEILRINKLNLPNVSRASNNVEIKIFPEGKQEETNNIGTLSPIILSNNTKYKAYENENTISSMNPQPLINSSDNNISPSNKSSLELKLNYEFEICDYIFINLNDYLNLTEFSLPNLYEFLSVDILPKCPYTSLVMVFPNMDNVKKEDISILLKIISISRFTVIDLKDAINFGNQLGYKLDESNFAERFICLKEFTKNGQSNNRTVFFFDNFSNLTVVSYDSLSNQINTNEEYRFNIGFKISFFNAITLHYDFLKSTFFGGFFSKLIKKKFNYNAAFEIGLSTLKKVLTILDENSLNYREPENPDYFIYKVDKSLQKLNEYYNSNSEKRFNYNTSNQDDHLNSFYPKGKMKLKKISNSNLNKIDYLSQTQKKFMGILQTNQKLERKLKKFFSTIPENEFRNNPDLNELNKIGRTSFQKIVLKPLEEKPKIAVQKNETKNNEQMNNQVNDKKINHLNTDVGRSPIKYHENTYHNVLDASNLSNNNHQFKKEFKDYQYFDRKFASNKYKHMQQPKHDPYSLSFNPIPQEDNNKENVNENKDNKPTVTVYRGVYVLAQTDNDMKMFEKEKKFEEERLKKIKEEERKASELKKIEEQKKNDEKKNLEEFKKQEEQKKQKKVDDNKAKEETTKVEDNNTKKKDVNKKVNDIQEDIVEDLSVGNDANNKKKNVEVTVDRNKDQVKNEKKEENKQLEKKEEKPAEGKNQDIKLDDLSKEPKVPEENKQDLKKDTNDAEVIKEDLPKPNNIPTTNDGKNNEGELKI